MGTTHATVPDVWPCVNTVSERSMPMLSLMWKGCPAHFKVNSTVLPAGKLKVGFDAPPVELKR